MSEQTSQVAWLLPATLYQQNTPLPILDPQSGECGIVCTGLPSVASRETALLLPTAPTIWPNMAALCCPLVVTAGSTSSFGREIPSLRHLRSSLPLEDRFVFSITESQKPGASPLSCFLPNMRQTGLYRAVLVQQPGAMYIHLLQPEMSKLQEAQPPTTQRGQLLCMPTLYYTVHLGA